jgi:predicted DNA-binding transcriptional regulator AlpA
VGRQPFRLQSDGTPFLSIFSEGPQQRPRKPPTPGLRDKQRVERLPEIDQVLGTHDVKRITGRHRCTIYRWVCAGTFPPKRAGGGRGWLRSDVERWLNGPGIRA